MLLDQRKTKIVNCIFRTASITCALCLAVLCIQSKIHLNHLEEDYKAKKASLQAAGLADNGSTTPHTSTFLLRSNPTEGSKHKEERGPKLNLPKELEGVDLSKISADALNTTKTAGLDMLFFNRVGKTGSEMINRLIDLLSDENDFEIYMPNKYEGRYSWLDKEDEGKLADKLASVETPGAYIGHHVSLVNFTRFNLPMPIYINMVRDPVERVISWYYYVRQPIHPVRKHRRWPNDFNYKTMPDPDYYKRDFETCVLEREKECTWTIGDRGFRNDQRRQTLFFCAHGDNRCRAFNSVYAAQKAKQNVERYYAVVGVQEFMDITLKVLEKYIPLFFTNVIEVYNVSKIRDGLNQQNKNHYKVPVSEPVKEIVRRNFTSEIDFYYFCRQRLFKQYYAILSDEERETLMRPGNATGTT